MKDTLLKNLAQVARDEEKAREKWEAEGEAVELTALEQAALQRVAQRTLSRRSHRVWIGLAMAAAVFLVWQWPQDRAPLPTYQLEVIHAGTHQVRGDVWVPIIRMAPGAPVTLLLRPSVPNFSEVAVRSFLVSAKEQLPVQLDVEVSTSGAIKVAGVFDQSVPQMQTVREVPFDAQVSTSSAVKVAAAWIPLWDDAQKIVLVIGPQDAVEAWAKGERHDSKAVQIFEVGLELAR